MDAGCITGNKCGGVITILSYRFTVGKQSTNIHVGLI